MILRRRRQQRRRFENRRYAEPSATTPIAAILLLLLLCFPSCQATAQSNSVKVTQQHEQATRQLQREEDDSVHLRSRKSSTKQTHRIDSNKGNVQWEGVSQYIKRGTMKARKLQEADGAVKDALETLIGDFSGSGFVFSDEGIYTAVPTPEGTMTLEEMTELLSLTDFPTSGPSYHPSKQPSQRPTAGPSDEPSQVPTAGPVEEPSQVPTEEPSLAPTVSLQPSDTPSDFPSLVPTISAPPSVQPSQSPTGFPTTSTQPSDSPSDVPSSVPTISMEPSATPSISLEPTASSMPSDMPSDVPSDVPSDFPTMVPTLALDDREDNGMTMLFLTDSPSESPSASQMPSSMPSTSRSPTIAPSHSPSNAPTLSMVPSQSPSVSNAPTVSMSPSDVPSSVPSDRPSFAPSISTQPSDTPSTVPSSFPSDFPSDFPSEMPTLSAFPSTPPSSVPSWMPSEFPSNVPSTKPSVSPSSLPSITPSANPTPAPSSAPSSSPTLVCHDEPDYRSPINGFECRHHQGTSCLQWRHLGLTLDDLEALILSCPVSCNIDCGTATRFDISLSYQISKVPGLLDADTVDDLNVLTRDYLRDYVRVTETQPNVNVFIDNVELLSQTILSRGERKALSSPDDRQLQTRDLDDYVNLWVTVANRGFAFNLTVEETTSRFISGIDSRGYSDAIRSSGNYDLEFAYAFSAHTKEEDNITPMLEDAPDDGNGSSAAIVVVVVVFICLVLCGVGAYVYHRQSFDGLPLPFWRYRRSRKVVERDLQSPESQNVLSNVGSMFSFDDSATAGTNGLMRYIGSFSRSKDSTSPGSSVQELFQNEPPDEGAQHDAELGQGTPTLEEDEVYLTSQEEEEEPHPLTGIIPPMIVYDHIDDDGEKSCPGQNGGRKRQRETSVVPSRRVEATSSFKMSLGNRDRPSAANDLAEYFSETSDFISDPLKRWNRLESGRPSPIGIVMDSDDDVSVASTPARLRSDTVDTTASRLHRKTRSLDDGSILESVSDIIVSEIDYGANVSPIEVPSLGMFLDTPPAKGKGRQAPMASTPPSITNQSPSSNANVSFDFEEGPDPLTGKWGERNQVETPPKRNSSNSQGSQSKNAGGAGDVRYSFWSRSPIARGVKDALWSKKGASTVTPRNGPPTTPTLTEAQPPRRYILGASLPSTPTRNEVVAVRRPLQGPPSPTRTDATARRVTSLHFPPPTTPTSRPELPQPKRSSTPTKLEMLGRRVPTPTRLDQARRMSASPVGVSANSHSENNSEGSHGERSHRSSLRSRSASFGTAQESLDEEVHFEFTARRMGKLGLVINSSPHTGPIVEQVKDYSTLFGRILAGDRIIEVDGVETSHMSTKDVTKRLSGKYGIRTSSEVRIKVARVREREWFEDNEERRSLKSSGSNDSHHSVHRRNYSDPEPLLDRLSLNSMSEHHRLSSNSYSNNSRSGEEV